MSRSVLRTTSTLLRSLGARTMSTTSTAGPLETALRKKVLDILPYTTTRTDEIQIGESLQPSRFEVFNDSSKHSHHRAMVGNTSSETHFRYYVSCRHRLLVIGTDTFMTRSLEVVSASFENKTRVARHRMVYGLLRDEIEAAGGIHALQLFLKTPAEAGEQAAIPSSEGDTQKQDPTSPATTIEGPGTGQAELETDQDQR